MATNTAGTQGRQHAKQLVHYLRKTVNFDDVGVATGVKVGTLPAGAQILFTTVNVQTAFDAGTANVLTVGQNASSYNDIVAAGDVDESLAEAAMVLRGSDLEFTADKDVYATFTESGTAATTGKAHIVICYAADNDG